MIKKHKFRNEFINYIKANFNHKIVSSGTELQETDYCPFCLKEKKNDTRVYIDLKTGLGICFHCGKGFTPISFIMEKECCVYKEAVKILNQYKHSDFETIVKLTDVDSDKDKETKVYFPELIDLKDTAGYDYLIYRFKDNDKVDLLINKFSLKYSPKKMRFEDKIYATQKRIIIPIYNIYGECVGWQGRDVTDKSFMKYYFWKFFKAREHLYNIQNINLSKYKYLILVEGTFDVFGWYLAGFKNVVASFGKKVTDEQFNILKRLNIEHLFIAWDTDAIKEKYEFIEKYGSYFKDIRIIDLEGNDSDECNKDYLLTRFKKAFVYDWKSKIKAMM